MQKRYIFLASIFALTILISNLLISNTAGAVAVSGDFNAGRIIDDSVFRNSTSMSVQEIQNFLNAKNPSCDTMGTQTSEFGEGTRAQYGTNRGYPPPYVCLKDYYENVDTKANNLSGNPVPAGAKSAAQIIYDYSQQYHINPQVLITLIQKESIGPMITDSWPFPSQYRTLTGYGCPDTAPCDSQYFGFSNQIRWSSRMFQAIIDNDPSWYMPYPTTGIRNILFSPNDLSSSAFLINNPGGSRITSGVNSGRCGSNSINVLNRSTLSLYNYTPYQPNQSALNNLYGSVPSSDPNGQYCAAYGNRNFWRMFTDWFGSTISGKCLAGYTNGSPLTGINFRKVRKNFDSGNFIVYSDSQSGCVETHVWNYNFTGWESNNASNSPTINPADSVIKFADLDGDGKDEPVLVWFKNTPSGMVEFHVWNSDMKSWIVKAASNLPTSALTGVAIDFADLNGDGKDEPLAFGYSGTSTGFVEVHIWGNSITEWQNHTITNLPVIDPAKMQIGFANFDGNGPDEMVAFGISDTASGKIEFHLWNPGFASWRSHHITNHGVIDANNSSIYFGDLDGNGVDSAILIHTKGTTSGRIEMHVWKSSLNEWEFNSASNMNAAP